MSVTLDAMQIAAVTDADHRYLAEIADDCRRLLGPGADLELLELGTNDELVLRARYRLGPAARISEGRGDSILAAHRALRAALVSDRVGLAMRALLEGGPTARR